MNKTILGSLAGLALLVASAPSALAINTIVLTWPSGYGDFPDGGGEFTAQTSDTTLVTPYNIKATRDLGGNVRGFQTFCIEFTEEFYPGATYTYDISPNARNGGRTIGPDGSSDAFGAKDPVSVGTAFLYSQFAKGELTGYNYTPSSGANSREASARSLQNLIWFLEGEKDAPLNDALTTEWLSELDARFHGNEAYASAFDYAANQVATAANYGVSALNLGPNDSGTDANVQDQLVYRGGGFQRVPDGGVTFGMLSLASIGLLGLKRRFGKTS